MIAKEDILLFGRYKYDLPFIGSYQGMRYKIVHKKPAEGEENIFNIDIWPEPFCYEKTDESKIIKTTFPYSEESYNQIVPYLNKVYEENQDLWN